MDKLRLANAKLQAEPGNAALKLMDCVFSVEEMVNGNPSGVTKSKDDDRKKTIKPLPAEKMKFINGTLYFVSQYQCTMVACAGYGGCIDRCMVTIQSIHIPHRYSTRKMGENRNGQRNSKENDAKMYTLLQ